VVEEGGDNSDDELYLLSCFNWSLAIFTEMKGGSPRLRREIIYRLRKRGILYCCRAGRDARVEKRERFGKEFRASYGRRERKRSLSKKDRE